MTDSTPLLDAAPDMLAALVTTAGNIRSLGPAGAIPRPYEVWLEVVDAAIAKARGEVSQAYTESTPLNEVNR